MDMSWCKLAAISVGTGVALTAVIYSIDFYRRWFNPRQKKYDEDNESRSDP